MVAITPGESSGLSGISEPHGLISLVQDPGFEQQLLIEISRIHSIIRVWKSKSPNREGIGTISRK